jgi:hypothetical protein
MRDPALEGLSGTRGEATSGSRANPELATLNSLPANDLKFSHAVWMSDPQRLSSVAVVAERTP